MEALEIQLKDKFGNLTIQDAEAFKVVDLETKKVAAARRDLAQAMIDYICDDERDGLDKRIKLAHASWKSLTDWKKKLLAGPQQIVDFYKTAISTYDFAEKKRREDQERELNAKLRKEDEDSRLSQAVELEQDGRQEEAMALLKEPISTPSVHIEIAEEEKVQSYRDNWSAEIFDLKAMVKELAQRDNMILGVVGIEPVKDRQGIYESTFWNQQARGLKSMLDFPGVRAVNHPVPISR